MKRLVKLFAALLEREEREAVLGDLTEAGASEIAALRDVVGLLVRRQWTWHTLLLLLPMGGLLGLAGRSTADGTAVYIWLYANNWDWTLVGNAGFRHDLAHYRQRSVFFRHAGLLVMRGRLLGGRNIAA
jgi:hypothetical protein